MYKNIKLKKFTIENVQEGDALAGGMGEESSWLLAGVDQDRSDDVALGATAQERIPTIVRLEQESAE